MEKLLTDRYEDKIDVEEHAACYTLNVARYSMKPNNPVPRTPYSKPQTPNPVPQTPNPVPQTPNPVPQTPNPVPRTPNPAPQTPHPKPRTLRVLHIINKLDRVRGSTTWLLNVLTNKANTPVKHWIVENSGEAGDRESDFEQAGIPTIHLRCNYYFPFPFIVKLRKVIKELDIDIVHSHMSMLGGIDACAAWLAGIKHRIVYLHSGEWLHGGSLRHRVLSTIPELSTRLFATAIWGPSNGVIERWFPGSQGNPKYRAVLGGVPLDPPDMAQREPVRKELGYGPKHFVIGHVGRFTEQKNHVGILKTFSFVAEKLPGARLLLAGDGPLFEPIKTLAQELGIAGKVEFLGVRPDLSRLYTAMDVFFFPSLYEPLGLAVVEAQNAGLPVVASDIDGLREALAPQWKEYLCTLGNDEANAELLVTVLKNARRTRPDGFLSFFSLKAASLRLFDAYRELGNMKVWGVNQQ